MTVADKIRYLRMVEGHLRGLDREMTQKELIEAIHKELKRSISQPYLSQLENGNRICLCSFMSAEYDDLPTEVQKEVQAFADVNIAWLGKTLVAAGVVGRAESEARARSIFAAISGAQLMARSRADISLFDALIDGYRAAGLLPDTRQGSRKK